ncbi:MAG: MBOAT family protein [Cytophagales bacterium]|nr:MBOAT family protein [Cytophagales bacterium]
MLFNSIEFAVFLPIVFLIYWFVANKNLKAQNFFVIIASYVFYGWWDWRFLSLIILSTIIDFSVGLGLNNQPDKLKRKLLLWTSIVANLGFLGFFKYYNFFLENFIQAFTLFGREIHGSSLHIILPVGISFYTFQTLSYTIDVYNEKLKPTKDLISFAAFVCFFPQLVAGPIERAKNLLPQFFQNRTFDYRSAVDGLRQILWGLFKKVVIADSCAEYVNLIFGDASNYSGSTLVLGAVFFAFQIYGDFSGYSDIAIGTARLFGFNLMRNFAFPYFSRDIAEFWRRWHISLSSWFRDYLYIPLGGSRGGSWLSLRNIFIIFVVSGFWHGANWTFIVWGALNAIYFTPLLLLKRNRKNIDIVAKGKFFPTFKDVLSIFSTFCITLIAWVFFRAERMEHAIQYLAGIFSPSLFNIPELWPKSLMLLILIFIGIEWIQREKQHILEINKLPLAVRWGAYMMISWCTIFFAVTNVNQDFIYFQF